MSEAVKQEKSVRPKRRWLLRLFYLLGTLLIVIIAARIYFTFDARKRLRDAVASLEKLDPQWRLEDLTANLTRIEDAKNSALVMINACEALPEELRVAERTDDHINEISIENDRNDLISEIDSYLNFHPVNQKIPVEVKQKIRDLLKRAWKALEIAGGVYRLPAGRIPKVYADVGTPLQECARVIRLLSLLAIYESSEYRVERGWQWLVTAWHAANSFGDTPNVMAQVTRMLTTTWVIIDLERILGQTQFTDQQLAILQQKLSSVEKYPLLINAIKGERCLMVESILEAVENGDYEMRDEGVQEFLLVKKWLHFYLPTSSFYQYSLAYRIEWYNDLMEAAQLPLPQQIDAFQRFDRKIKSMFNNWVRFGTPEKAIGILSIPGLVTIARTYHIRVMKIRCANVALAAERYRLKHGRWPESLEQLKPDFYSGDLLDPYSKKPLRYRRLPDRVVIYSVGPNMEDDGGSVPYRGHHSSTDIGFRMWNVDQRGIVKAR